MNATTINSASFTLTSGGSAVAGTVTYAATGSVASFTPTASLAPDTLFTATITTAAQDTAAPPMLWQQTMSGALPPPCPPP